MCLSITDAYWFLLDTYALFKYANKLVDAPGNQMPVAATNETPAGATSAVPVEQANETPAVATSSMPVEQSNDTGVASNNEMSITVPPHLLAVAPNTTTLTVQTSNYEPFPPDCFVKYNGKEILVHDGVGCIEMGCIEICWSKVREGQACQVQERLLVHH